MNTRTRLLVVLAVLMPDCASAQAGVVPGERVRVSGERSWTGVVQRSTPDSIVLLADGADQPLLLALSALDRIDVFEGRKSRAKGFLVGAGVGGLAGLLLGVIGRPDADDCHGPEPESMVDVFARAIGEGICESVGMAMLIYTPALGVLFGGGIGALVNGGEKWTTVDAPVDVALAGSPRGQIGARFNLRF